MAKYRLGIGGIGMRIKDLNLTHKTSLICMDAGKRADHPRLCCECYGVVRNPFYVANLVVRGPRRRVGFSVKAINLCKNETSEIEKDFLDGPDKMDSEIGYAVSAVTGGCHERGGAAQVFSDVYDVHGDYKFLNRDVARKKLPKTTEDLEEHYIKIGQYLLWTEKDKDDDLKEVIWPQWIFMRVMTSKK